MGNLMFMAYQSLNDVNITGLSGIFIYVSSNVPLFIPLFLLCVGSIVGMATYFSSIRTKGYGDPFLSIAVAGFFAGIVGVFMSFIPDLVAPIWTILSVIIALVCIAMLFTQGNED